MGYEVIAFLSIEIFEGSERLDTKKIKEILEDDVYNLSIEEDSIAFEMSGNKGIDYSSVDKVKDYLEKQKVKFEITGSEFAETGSGYYYSTYNE